MTKHQEFQPGDLIRIPDNHIVRGYRVWKITGVVHGALGQEGHYQLRPLNRGMGNAVGSGPCSESLVPVWMLETHRMIERV